MSGLFPITEPPLPAASYIDELQEKEENPLKRPPNRRANGDCSRGLSERNDRRNTRLTTTILSVAEKRKQLDPGCPDEPGTGRSGRLQLRSVRGCSFVPDGLRPRHHEHSR